MLKLDSEKKTLQVLPPTSLADESILERYGLQAAIVSSWDAFCMELGLGPLRFVDQEVMPHASCRDAIDILALDRDGTPVIIELKRDKNKLQLLQALTYAAMLSTWTPDDFITRLGTKPGYDSARIILQSMDSMPTPKLVLVAESYDPEVILTADFLRSKEAVEVYAFAINLTSYESGILLSLEQKYPLAALNEMYVARGQRRSNQAPAEVGPPVTWEEVASVFEYDFAPDAICFFKRWNEGRPDKRYFSTHTNALGKVYCANFRSDNIVIYFYDQSQEMRDRLEQATGIEAESWGRDGDRRSGWALRLYTREQYDSYVKAAGG